MVSDVAPVTPSGSAFRHRRATPLGEDDPEVQAIMRQIRLAILTMMDGLTVEQSAELAAVSSNTLVRIMRGENMMVTTFAKIVGNMGGQLTIKVER